MLDITEALEEIQNENEAAIETKTALKWAARSAACFQLALEAEDEMVTLSWLFRGIDTEHEALEHAAFADDDGKLLAELKSDIMVYKMKALGIT